MSDLERGLRTVQDDLSAITFPPYKGLASNLSKMHIERVSPLKH
jgi:hypothetical protein